MIDWWQTLNERQQWRVIGAAIILILGLAFFAMATYAFMGTDYRGVGDWILALLGR